MEETKTVETFLAFLHQAGEKASMAEQTEQEANDETQDILHRLELHEDGAREMARMAELLRETRRKRRMAMDERETALAVALWAEGYQAAVKALERVLGELRKCEKRRTLRYYHTRTKILDKLDEGDASCEMEDEEL